MLFKQEILYFTPQLNTFLTTSAPCSACFPVLSEHHTLLMTLNTHMQFQLHAVYACVSFLASKNGHVARVSDKQLQPG